jgi:hypothetical protein
MPYRSIIAPELFFITSPAQTHGEPLLISQAINPIKKRPRMITSHMIGPMSGS